MKDNVENNIFKRADLLGISVYDLIKNYVFIFDSETWFYGVALKTDIDEYMISHDGYSDSMILVDLEKSIDNLQVLNYRFLEEILENR